MTTLPTNDRPKINMARLVDAAIEMQVEYGARAAAAFLTAHGAGFALTVRVLAEPERRRARS